MANRVQKFCVKMSRSKSERCDDSLVRVINRALTSTRRNKGWEIVRKETLDEHGSSVSIHLVCRSKRMRDLEIVRRELNEIVESLSIDSWTPIEIDGEKFVQAKMEVAFADKPLPENVAPYFSHIYGREAQINLLLSAVQAGIDSEWENRFHTVLWGEPAGGKTECARCLRKMLGDEMVLEFDGTAVSQAGLVKVFKERSEAGCLPRILVIEEIEKGDENNWRPLLGLLDHRGEIRKDNFRESIHIVAKLLCIATVNNKEKFDSFLAGALSSRFSNPIWCPRPDAELMRRILQRDLSSVQEGKLEWVEPAIQFASRHGWNDPRSILRIMLCGKDDLITGEYQRRVEMCLPH